MASEPFSNRAMNAQASSMVTACFAPVAVWTRSLMKVSVMALTEMMSPLIQRCYKHEQVPVEIEFGRRLAQRCLVPEPPVERVRPLRRRRYAGKASR